MNSILNQVEKGREQLKHWGSIRFQQVQERRQELRRRGEDVLDQGRTRAIILESNVLQQATNLLARASDSLGPRASFLKQGEKTLTDRLVTVRAESSATLPVDDFDALSIKKLSPHLDTMDELGLRTVRAYEAKNKNRVTLLRAIDDLLDQRAGDDLPSN